MMRLPRALRKRNVFEEVRALLARAVGKKVLRESYQQLRKYNVWNVATFKITSSSSRRTSRAGARQQPYPLSSSAERSLGYRGFESGLSNPRAAKDAVMSHPEPEKLIGKKFSQFTYYHTDERRPLIVTMRNVASREMLYCASSSGSHFDQRAKDLKEYTNVVEGIIANA